MRHIRRFFSLYLALVFGSLCAPCQGARKPYILPPDIIGDSAKDKMPPGYSRLGISPEQINWQRTHHPQGFDYKIDTATANFFPKEAPLNNFEKQWYRSSLVAMGENSFRTLSKEDTVYRFLWLRSFHHPICVSVKILNHGNGGAILHAVELDGGDTYGVPKGKQLRNFSHRYYPKLTKELIAKIESSQFWTMPQPTDPMNSIPHSVEISGTTLGTSGPVGAGFKYAPNVWHLDGFDGAQWVMEGFREGKYRMVRRWSPKDGSFRELCVIFLLLAGLYPKENQAIY